MVDHSRPLTDEQRQLAEEYHGLIYAFLRERRLDEGEFYDVVVFGYLNAVRKWTELPHLRTYSFKTIAFKSMLTSTGNERKKNARRIQTTSLDAENGEGHSLYDVLVETAPDGGDSGGQYAAQYADLLKALTRRQKAVLSMKSNGYTSRQISEMLHIKSPHAVDNIAYRARATALRAEHARSERLRAKVQQQLGQDIPRQDFERMETIARHRLARYKIRHPEYRRQESALPKIIAEIAAEPSACGGGTIDSLRLKGGAHDTSHHYYERRAA